MAYKQNYAQALSSQHATQGEKPFDHPEMIQNHDGAFVFEIDALTRATRFLILGSEANTYYQAAKELTQENAKGILEAFKHGLGKAIIDLTVEISDAGRAPKNEPAIFVMALAMVYGDQETRNYAVEAFTKVIRIGKHLFQFFDYCVQLKPNLNRTIKRAIAKWYNEKTPFALAKQLTKYRSREKHSHYDVLNLAHVLPKTQEHERLFHYVVNGVCKEGDEKGYKKMSSQEITDLFQKHVDASPEDYKISPEDYYRLCGSLEGVDEMIVIEAINRFGLPREVVPTNLQKSKAVWKALLGDDEGEMPYIAAMRNCNRMTAVGVFAYDYYRQRIVALLGNEESIRKSRVHPLQLYIASKTYGRGRGLMGSMEWEPDSLIVKALDKAFYKAFDYLTPTGKRYMICLDVSGSMDSSCFSGCSHRELSTVMAQSIVSVEDDVEVMAFSGKFTKLPTLKGPDSVKQMVKITDGMDFEYTNCSLPMIYAQKEKLPIDCFIVFTDNETNCIDSVHPYQALKNYRKAMGIPNAKLIVCATTPVNFSIADPNDPNMLDISGFDASIPRIITEFVNGFKK